MSLMNALIVENEEKNVRVLQSLLSLYCPQVTVLNIAKSVREAKEMIVELNPELVFMDIELDDGLAFDILKDITERNFELIFTTAYDHYAIKAIKYAAIDYLLKPISPEVLQDAVKRAGENRARSSMGRQIDLLLKSFHQIKDDTRRIALPTLEGYEFIELNDILRMESDGSYTVFYLDHGRKIMVSKPMKEYEELLDEENFMRVHHSWIINMSKITKYFKGSGGNVVLNDGSSVDISARKKQEFLHRIKK